jgi:uncharacterized protein YihD (DUF1040 family)
MLQDIMTVDDNKLVIPLQSGKRRVTMGLVEELKEEHRQIIIYLMSIEFLGDDEVVSSKKIDELDQLLINHLLKEDAELVPILKKYSQVDTSSVESEMGRITVALLAFFLKYSGKALNTPGLKKIFESDFTQLSNTLVNRFKLEETYFFAEYVKNRQ